MAKQPSIPRPDHLANSGLPKDLEGVNRLDIRDAERQASRGSVPSASQHTGSAALPDDGFRKAPTTHTLRQGPAARAGVGEVSGVSGSSYAKNRVAGTIKPADVSGVTRLNHQQFTGIQTHLANSLGFENANEFRKLGDRVNLPGTGQRVGLQKGMDTRRPAAADRAGQRSLDALTTQAVAHVIKHGGEAAARAANLDIPGALAIDDHAERMAHLREGLGGVGFTGGIWDRDLPPKTHDPEFPDAKGAQVPIPGADRIAKTFPPAEEGMTRLMAAVKLGRDLPAPNTPEAGPAKRGNSFAKLTKEAQDIERRRQAWSTPTKEPANRVAPTFGEPNYAKPDRASSTKTLTNKRTGESKTLPVTGQTAKWVRRTDRKGEAPISQADFNKQQAEAAAKKKSKKK
jgi:hypothetical protein